MHVTATELTPSELPLLRSLFPLYLHDLSEHGSDYHLDEHGLWQPAHLVDYWFEARPETRRLLLRADGELAGFALVGQRPFPYMDRGSGFRLSEFFVLRGLRRRGVGRAAANALFSTLRGTWELSELPGNEAAIRFWRAVIGEHTGGRYEERMIDGHPTQFFTSGG